MKSSTILTLVLAVMIASCQNRKEDYREAAAVYTEAMRIHDEVMPKMDELFSLQQKLSARRDSLKIDSVKNDAALRDLQSGLDQLTTADQGMRDWMHHIKDVPGAAPGEHAHHASSATEAPAKLADEVLKEQNDQKTAIEKVKKAMEESIANAKKLLGKN